MRTLRLAVIALTLSACGFGHTDPDPAAGDLDAATMKSRVDNAARTLAPRLSSALDAELEAGGAGFTQCQMSANDWQYQGNLALAGPPVKDYQDQTGDRLQEGRYTIGTAQDGGLVADNDQVHLSVSGPVPGNPIAVYNISIGIDCTPLSAEDEELAWSTTVNDFTARP